MNGTLLDISNFPEFAWIMQSFSKLKGMTRTTLQDKTYSHMSLASHYRHYDNTFPTFFFFSYDFCVL